MKRYRSRKKYRFNWHIACRKHNKRSNYLRSHYRKGNLRKIFYHDECASWYIQHQKRMPFHVKRLIWNKNKNN